MGEKNIDARSDIYALGAVAYEMLVGEPPFTGPSVQAIVARLVTEEPRPIAVQRKAVPAYVEAAVLHALEKLPADRFATAPEFAAALRDGPASFAATTSRGRAATSVGVRRPWMRPAAAASGLALLAAAGMVGWMSAQHALITAPDADLPTLTSILPPPGGVFGEQRSLALTPDGRRLAFVFAATKGTRMLWLRQLDRLEATPIRGTVGADEPFWSPDGRSLGFFSGGYLTVLDEDGDTRRLCPVSGATGGSWSVKDLILFSDRDGVSTVPAQGGECHRIVPRGAGPPPTAAFLPDGDRLLYSRSRQFDIVAATLKGDSIGALPVNTNEFEVAAPGYLLMSSENDPGGLDAQRINLKSLALEGPAVRIASDVRAQAGVPTFAVSSNGVVAFLPGGVDRPYLVYDANGLLRDTVRVDGTWTIDVRPRVAGPPLVAVAGNTVGVWLYDLDGDRATRLLVHDSTFSTAGMVFGTSWPVFNADGSHLVFAVMSPTQCRVVDRDLATDTWRVVAQETVPTVRLCPKPLDWSADGRHLLVRRDTLLQIMSVDGSSGIQQIVRPGRLLDGHFSPDGRSIAYSSDETGQAEIYVQQLPSGPPIRVSLEGGRWPAWSHAGHRLTFLTPDGRVQQVDVGATRGGSVGTPRTLFTVPTWRRNTFDDDGAGFAMVGDGERYLVRQSPSGLAVAFVQHWPTLLHRGNEPKNTGSRQ